MRKQGPDTQCASNKNVQITLVYWINYCHEAFENQLNQPENRLLKRISGQKGDEVTTGWVNLHSVTLHDLYFPAHKLFRRSNEEEWYWNCDMHWTMRNGYNTLTGQPEVRRRTGALEDRHIWENDIKMRLKDRGSNRVNPFGRPLTDLTQLGHFRIEWQAPVNTEMESWFVLWAGNVTSSWVTGRFPRTAVLPAATVTQ